jgi:ubiquinone/menaquinone biosynthesis C-methylase UbiE
VSTHETDLSPHGTDASARESGVGANGGAVSPDISDVVRETREYYDGPADEIYRLLWRDNVHMGTWEPGVETLQEAMELTNRRMARLARIEEHCRVLDVGCGYGETAFHLAREHGCEVVGINISAKELDLARERTPASGVADRVSFRFGDFHELPFPDAGFDVVWSQEAFLHGADKGRILSECRRVLRPGGRLVISDLLLGADVPEEERQRIQARVKSPQMWDADAYRSGLEDSGFEVEVAERWDDNVAPTYQAVLDGLRTNRADLESRGVPREQLDATDEALQLWVERGRAGKIGQGLFVATRP